MVNVDQASHLRKIMEKESRMPDKHAAARTGNSVGEGPRVFSITSGKGGVGKTNLVANLALAFRNLGKRVLIFDGDLGLANIDIVFGVHPQYNINHVVSGEKELSEVITEIRDGISIIPALSGDESMSELSESQKLSLLSEFETLEDLFDVVLVDTAAGISTNVIYFNLAAEECIVVVTGEPTSITDAYGIIKVLYGHGAKRFKILVNMVSGSDEAKVVYYTLSKAAERFLKGAITEYMGFIPADPKVRDSVIARVPLLEKFPESPSAKAVTQLAAKLAGSFRRTDLDGNIKFFMQRLMRVR
jgi:flagellar biosynthesis protein FlhG